MINSITITSTTIDRAFNIEAAKLIHDGLSLITVDSFKRLVIMHALKHDEANTVAWLKDLSKKISNNYKRAIGLF